MSVLGYFGRRRGELRMPKAEDHLGIRYEGPVLTGKMSVELRLKKDGVRTVPLGKVSLPQDCDEVLRAHCRFDDEGKT